MLEPKESSDGPGVVQLRMALRLRRRGRSIEFAIALGITPALVDQVAPPIVFTETINGRAYVIEVHPIARDRWRACLARRGATTALMPFYGPTPDEAAQQLAGWLTRASGTKTQA